MDVSLCCGQLTPLTTHHHLQKYTLALLLPARTPVEELAALDAALACITNLASDLQLDGIQEHLQEAGPSSSPRSEASAGPHDDEHSPGEEQGGEVGEDGEQAAEVDADGLVPHEAHLLASASLAQVAAASTAASIGASRTLPHRGEGGSTPMSAASQASIANAAAVATALRDIDLLEHVETDEARVRDAAAEVSGVAARIAKGGELVADAVVKSKDFAAQGMHLVGSLVKTRVAPPPPSRRAVQVGPATKKAIAKTQRLTEIALEGSKLALSTAAYTFKFVGTSVSASVQETRLYHSLVALAHRRAQARAAATAAAAAAAASGGQREVAVSSSGAQRMLSSLHQAVTPSLSPEDVHKAKMVMGTVLTSCLGVYRTCKAALWEFTDDLRDLTTDLTDHYYGPDASSAAGAAFDSVRNVGTIMLNVDSMPSGPSNVAFTVAKESSLDILALDEWLSGAVLAHGYMEAFSPIATWMPQWMLLRSSALLVYNVRTGKATRPVEVVTVADITGAWAVSAPSQADAHAAGSASGYDAAQSASCSHFEVSTQELSYRLRVRSPALRQQWLDAILTAVAAHKKLAPKVVLSEEAESFVNAEQATLEAWKDAVQAHITQWETKLGIKAAKAAEAADSWATLQAWASHEASARAAEAAAEVSAFVSVIPSSVEARLPVDASAQLARARNWANATLASSASSGTTDPSALLDAAEQHMRQWLAANPRLCSPDVAIHAIGAAAGTVVASAEEVVHEALHVLERPPPLLTADVLSTAVAWAESAEAVFSPSTAYAQRRLAEASSPEEAPPHKSASAPVMATTTRSE